MISQEETCGRCNHYAPLFAEFGNCLRLPSYFTASLRIYDEKPPIVCKDFIPREHTRACLQGRKHHSFRERKTEGANLKDRPETTCRWCKKTWRQVHEKPRT